MRRALVSGDLEVGAGWRVRWAWWHEGGTVGAGRGTQGIVVQMKGFCGFLRIRRSHWMVWSRRMTQSDLHFKDYFNHSLIKWLIQQMFMEDAFYVPGVVLGAWFSWGTLRLLVKNRRNVWKTSRQEISFSWHLCFMITSSKFLVAHGRCILKPGRRIFNFC